VQEEISAICLLTLLPPPATPIPACWHLPTYLPPTRRGAAQRALEERRGSCSALSRMRYRSCLA